MEELPKLTEAERRAVLDQLLQLNEPPLSASDEALVESRLAEHRADPGSSLPLEEMKRRLRAPAPPKNRCTRRHP